MVPEISKGQSNRILEVLSDLPSVKFGINNYSEIKVNENEQHLEISRYARKQCVNSSPPYARASL